jgi:hypothetical protein
MIGNGISIRGDEIDRFYPHSSGNIEVLYREVLYPVCSSIIQQLRKNHSDLIWLYRMHTEDPFVHQVQLDCQPACFTDETNGVEVHGDMVSFTRFGYELKRTEPDGQSFLWFMRPYNRDKNPQIILGLTGISNLRGADLFEEVPVVIRQSGHRPISILSDPKYHPGILDTTRKLLRNGNGPEAIISLGQSIIDELTDAN